MTISTFPIRGTGSSKIVVQCQICKSEGLQSVLFLGYLPLANSRPPIGSHLKEHISYPTEVLFCNHCGLAQLGTIVDPELLFPANYPTSTTRLLRDNFADLYKECADTVALTENDLVVDIGSSDGTLLSHFKNSHCRVLGIEPTLASKQAIANSIPTEEAFFDISIANRLSKSVGYAKIITATNVLAHTEDVHDTINAVSHLLRNDGLFVSESQYLPSILERFQYDIICHEHIRYYSLRSLNYLLNAHGFEVINCKPIPTHGGSIRIYAARSGHFQTTLAVNKLRQFEDELAVDTKVFDEFRKKAALCKLELQSIFQQIKFKGHKIYGVGAAARASTLIGYVGIDDSILDCVVEVSTSQKLRTYIPGTIIPVKDEQCLFDEQPEYALILSWHVAEDVIRSLFNKGFRGKYIIPLPNPVIKDVHDLA